MFLNNYFFRDQAHLKQVPSIHFYYIQIIFLLIPITAVLLGLTGGAMEQNRFVNDIVLLHRFAERLYHLEEPQAEQIEIELNTIGESL